MELKNNFIYELRDVSEEEVYYTLGFFRSFEEAKDVIESLEKQNEPISWYQEQNDSERLEVVQIPFGISNEYENWKTLLKIQRDEIYNEEEYNLIWQTTSKESKI